jgi:hypothetical protein
MTDKEVIETLIRIDERTGRVEKELKELSHRIIGNGKPGLVTDVAVITERVDSIDKALEGYRIPRQVWVGIIVSALIGLAGIMINIKQSF